MVGMGNDIMGVAFTLKDQFSKNADKIKASFTELDILTDKASKRINSGMSRIAQGASALALGAGIAAPFVHAINVTKEFDSQLSSTGATARATTEEIKLLRANALEMGSATKFSALEAAQAQEYLALAGFKVKDITQSMSGMLQVAAATNTDLATTADIVSDALTALGLKASDMDSLGDSIAKMTTTANTNLYQAGEAMKYAASGVAKLGGTKDDLLALIGMMGDVGLKGSIAGTSINQAMLQLIKIPSDKGKQTALAQLGLSNADLIDAKGNLRELTKVLPTIANAANKIQGNVKRSKILGDLFGVEGQRVIDALMSKSAKDFAAYVNQLKNSQGEADQIARDKLNNLKGDLTILASATETAMIKIGSQLTPFIRPIISALSSVIGLLGMFANTKVGQVTLFLVAGFSALLVTLGLLNIAMGVVSLTSGMLVNTFLKLGVQSVATAFATGGLTSGFYALAIATWTAIAPFLPFIAIGAVVIGAIVGITLAVRRGINEFNNLTDSATPIQRIFARIGGVIMAVKAIWNSFNTDTGEFTLAKTMADKLRKLGILDFVLNLSTWIVRLKIIFVNAFNIMSTVISNASSVVSSVFSYLKQSVVSVLSSLEYMGINITKLGGSMQTFANIGKILGRILGWIVAGGIILVGVAATAIVAPVVGAFNLITFVVQGLVSFIGDLISSIYNVGELFVNMGKSAFKFGISLVSNLHEGLKTAIPDLFSWLSNTMQSLPIVGGLFGDSETTNTTQTSSKLSNQRQQETAEMQVMKLKASAPNVNNTFAPNIAAPNVKVSLDGDELYRAIATISDRENQKY